MDFTNQLISSTPSRSSKELYKMEDFYSRRGKRMNGFRLRNLPTGDGRGFSGQVTDADQTIQTDQLRLHSWGRL